ncbi:MAG: NfeD family protein [Immundisolibacter sp.]|uniref:NfeD family protein n=1 Tax=Immundisolibacter sp. TaxID=1934948 RepID=UPI003EE1551D
MQYWHWLMLGMALIIAELFITSFFVFWFGLGALLVGLLVWLNPTLGSAWQVFGWSLASGLMTLLWFRYLRPLMKDRTQAGNARAAVIGEAGRVLRAPHGDKRGTVRFTTPLLGDDEWEFICDGSVVIGDRVYVKDFSGNTLVVEKRD